MDKGLKYLAGAIVFAAVVYAFVGRYQFAGNGMVRNDRWTGRSEIECLGQGWKTPDECSSDTAKRYERTGP